MKNLSIVFFLFLSIPAYLQASDLQKKLQQQFSKYNQARALLLNKVVQQDESLSRTEWENSLKIENPIDRDQLRQQQWLEIKANQEKAQNLSQNLYKINIDSFRQSQEKVKAFCKKFPKGGMLHIHGDGTLDRTTVKDILHTANPKVHGDALLSRVEDNGFYVYEQEEDFLRSIPQPVPYRDLQEQQALQDLFFLPKEPYSHSFSRFMAFFFIKGVIYKGEMKYHEVQEKVYRDFFVRAQNNKVIYVELSDAQLRPKKRSVAHLKKLAAVAKEYGVTARWNLAFYRNASEQDNRDKMKKWIKFLGENPTSLIVGIDFIADESDNPALEKGQGIYAQAYKTSQTGSVPLHRTMHAGELGHPSNVRDALIMGVERVGHGVKLWQDPIALEYARKVKLGIETNLVSNFRLQIVKDRDGNFCSNAFCAAEHPFIYFLRLGLPVSFSTDDEGLFETTISKECEVAVRTTDIQYSELRQTSINSIETSFVQEGIKSQLKSQLLQDLQDFESAWRNQAAE